MSTMFRSPAEIRAHALARPTEGNGHNWFEKGAMRWFKTRLLRGLYTSKSGRYYFVSSDARGFRDEDGRGYSVRMYDPSTNMVSTLDTKDGADGFNAYETAAAARSAARQFALNDISASRSH